MLRVMVEFADVHEHQAVMRLLAERRRQDRMFGEQNHDPAWWLVVMTKQLGQVADLITQYRWSNREDGLRGSARQSEQLAAVCIAYLACLARGAWVDEITTARPVDARQLATAMGRSDEDVHARAAEVD